MRSRLVVPSLLLCLALRLFAGDRDAPAHVSIQTDTASPGFQINGEPLVFGTDLQPQFSEAQVQSISAATRAGLEKWASTSSGQRLIRRFTGREYTVVVREDPGEKGAGRAPQPGIATLLAAGDHARRKTYEVILNPAFTIPDAAISMSASSPRTPADIAAAAWAAEMLHVDFYSRGIGLPHHPREDFQSEWHAVAQELGFPDLEHDDASDGQQPPPRRRPKVIFWMP